MLTIFNCLVLSIFWANPSFANPDLAAKIKVKKGIVNIQRNIEGKNYSLVTQPTQSIYPNDKTQFIYQSDTIIFEMDGLAFLFCNGGKRHTLERTRGLEVKVSEFCDNSNSSRYDLSFKNILTILRFIRNSSDSQIPYVISPHGNILSGFQKILWNEVSEAEYYIVKIKKLDSEESSYIWSICTKKTEINYPDKLVLEKGINYKVEIQAKVDDDYIHSEKIHKFSLLTELESKPILQLLEKVEQHESDQEIKLYALALLHLDHELYSEAIEILEPWVQTNIPKTYLYRLLGDIYIHRGLKLLAKNRYKSALSWADKEDNSREKELVQERLDRWFPSEK